MEHFSFAYLQSLPHTPIAQDWFGVSDSLPPAFCLAVSESLIGFSVKVTGPALCDRALRTGEFQAGLWQQDVAEFFLKEDGTDRYQEFNLSPAGAWWTQSFSDIRVPCQGKFQIPSSTKCFSQIDAGSWNAALVISRAELSITCALNASTLGNVNFILGEPQRFYSFAKIPLPQPDFHQPRYFTKPVLYC